MKPLHLLGATALTTGSAIVMAGQTAEEVRAEQEQIAAESQAIIAAADAANRDLTDDEVATITANKAKMDKLGQRAEILALAAAPAPLPSTGRKTAPEGAGQQRVPAEVRDTAKFGWKNFGDFAKAVRVAARPNSAPDQRLVNAATTYGSEGSGADGGFLVPPEFARELMVKVEAEENLLNRATQLRTGGNSLTIPKDETTPWQSTGGVQVYWEGEGVQATASKPAFETTNLRLVKLMALVNVTDEVLDDAPGLESWLRAKAPAKMAAKINTAFVRGTGVGQPLGMLTSPSLISVAKETSQTADTVWFANINKMWARLYAPWRRNAIWLINQDVEPQLEAMAFDPAASSKVPVYLGPTGVAGSPYATLKGRPVVPIEACSTVGDQGDIILVDMNQYWALTKAGGIRTDTSIHLYFDQAIQSFRFIFRVNGAPAWNTVISPENGSTTRSWVVTLDARG